MKKLRGIFLSLLTALLLVAPGMKANAADPVNFYVFYSKTCPHCEALLSYIDKLDNETKAKFNLIKYEVSKDADNSALMTKVANTLGTDTTNLGVPYMIIGEKTIIGFADNYSEEEIEAAIDAEFNNEDRYDVMDHLDDADSAKKASDVTIIIALSVIAVGVIGLLVFAKIKTK